MTTRQRKPTPQEIVNEALRRHRMGDLPTAAALYKESLKHSPEHPDILGALADAEIAMGQVSAGVSSLRRAVKSRPRSSELHARLAQGLFSLGDADAALSEADEALRLDASLPIAAQTKAQILRVMGRRKEAYDLLKPLIDAGMDDAGALVAFGEIASGVEGDAKALEVLERVAGNESLPAHVRAAALYRMAVSLDRMGEHARAFDAAKRANEATPARWDADAVSKQVDEVIASTGPEAVENFRRAKAVSDLPVFVLGMPRSGTSLVEQILASHPRVFAAGERREVSQIARRLLAGGPEGSTVGERLSLLRQGDVDREARGYVRTMQGLAGAGKTRVTDKMPHNFLYLSVIDAVFPGAHVIHCVRDARDTCLSCYMHEFHGGVHAYTRDLTSLARYYKDYERLMAHWERALRVPILRVRYEELVAAPERVVPRIVEFVGLEWDDACLKHHETDRPVLTLSAEQARKPIYSTARARWKAYETELAPLIEGMGMGGGGAGDA